MLTRPPLIVHLNDQSDCGTVDNAVVFHLDSIGSIPDLVHRRGVWAVSTVGERHSPRFYHQDQNSTQWCGWVCLAARRHTCVYLVISDGAVFTKHRIISVSHHIRSDQIRSARSSERRVLKTFHSWPTWTWADEERIGRRLTWSVKHFILIFFSLNQCIPSSFNDYFPFTPRATLTELKYLAGRYGGMELLSLSAPTAFLVNTPLV